MTESLRNLKLVRACDISMYDYLEWTLYYFAEEPLLKYMKKTSSQLRGSLLQKVMVHCYYSKYAFAYLDGNRIASVMIGLPYDQLLRFRRQQIISDPTVAIEQKSEEWYKPEDATKVMHLFLGTTDPKYQKAKAKWILKLILRIQQEATKYGFYQSFCLSTHPGSANGVHTIGYEFKNFVQYKSFEFQGYLPFKDLKSVDGMRFMLKKLKNNQQKQKIFPKL